MRQTDRIVYKEIRRNGGALVGVLLLMLLAVGFDILAPWPFKILIDNVLSSEPITQSGILGFLHRAFPSQDLLGFFAVFLYFGSTFALSIVEYLKAASTKRVVKNIITEFSKAAFNNLQTLAIGFYSKQKIGDYIYRLGYDVSALGELIEEGVLPLLTSALYLAGTIGIMFLISPTLALLSLAALPFLALGLHSFNRQIGTATKRSEFFNSVTFSFIEETLNHLKIIQAFSQERHTSAAFDRRIDTSLRNDIIVYRLDFLLALLVGIVIAISYSVVMLYGIQLVFSGRLTTGLLIVFIFYLDNLTSPLLALIYAATASRAAWVKIARMEDFFSVKSHLDYHAGAVKRLTGSDIRFEHVSFVTSGGKSILHNLTFTIEGGKRTAIFGVSGSGKTTLVNLLMRFMDAPTHGRILIGGTPLEAYDLAALRQQIAYVPQEITLFDDTLRNNIVFGNTHHRWEEIRRAARLAEAESFIRKLPGRYQFKVGEGGNALSGGQRQRSMLARAFMKEQAPILIFDETFSALDVETRREVLHNLESFSEGKTTVIISNVFDVIASADNIVVLNRGRLLYSGPARRLPKEISLYNMLMASEHDTES